jgi:hypothetical protein
MLKRLLLEKHETLLNFLKLILRSSVLSVFPRTGFNVGNNIFIMGLEGYFQLCFVFIFVCNYPLVSYGVT